MDFISLGALAAPVVIDLAKTIINRFVAPDQLKPTTVADYIQMKTMDLELFKVMNGDNGNPTYPWVEAIVRLQRPFIAAIALGVWAYSHTVGTPSVVIDEFASAVGFYLFADRSLFYIKKAMK
jgi:hypothetical protein